MTNIIQQIATAARTLKQRRAELEAVSEANSEAVRRIHRVQERIGRGRCTCEDEERAGLEFIERMRKAGAA